MAQITKYADIRGPLRIADVVATSNLDLVGDETIDGVAVTAALKQTVLVTGQTDKSENGLYYPGTSAWVRCEEAEMEAMFDSLGFVYVKQGTSYAGSLWRYKTAIGVTLESSNLEFEQGPHESDVRAAVARATAPLVVPTALQLAGGGAANVETLAAVKTLTVTDAQFQRLDCGGSGRTLTLPAYTDGLFFFVMNASDGAEDLTVADAAGTVSVLNQNEGAVFVSDGSDWYNVLGLTVVVDQSA